MPRSRSDISNSAIRIFLQNVGKFYDETRGFDRFVPNARQKDELLEYFDNACCFCNIALTRQTLSQDHLVPMNKTSLGLHAWGNVVPCCNSCNNQKQQMPWQAFLVLKAEEHAECRAQRIEEFVRSKYYDPDLNLHEYADNLYEDVGEVAMTLINLRYKQAESGITSLLGIHEAEAEEIAEVASSDVDWDRRLRSVGMKAFVTNFELFRSYAADEIEHADAVGKLIQLGVSNQAGASIRLGNAQVLFNLGHVPNALQKIIDSARQNDDIRNQARLLLTEYQ